MIENVSEIIENYLNEEGYKILNVDDEGNIRIRYQMAEVCIVPNKNVPNFVSVLIPNLDQMDSENPMPCILRCMHLVSTQLVVKAYPVDRETVIATYEFFFNDQEDLCFQVSTGIDTLMDLSRKYRRLKREDEEEARQRAAETERKEDDVIDDDENDDENDWDETEDSDQEPKE